jgi:hypothetical protein
MPPEILEACVDGDLVVFAGAGTSTENPLVLLFTLYSETVGKLGFASDEWPEFPAAMQLFEQRHGRSALLKEIKKRLDYVRSFPELDQAASRFHQELSTIFTITDIFTTNWDEYFERECGATPFITEQDWAFWRDTDRKVFKLHGSVTSPGSIVATEDDYRACYRRLNRGLLGATLKTMLATKTVVFVGYSFRDSDFNAVYRLLRRLMKDILPKAYIVTLDDRDAPDPVSNAHVIRTDATYFLEVLKAQLPESEFIPDVQLAGASVMAAYVSRLHHEMLEKLSLGDHPEAIFAATYQDGLIHAFDHQAANRRRGEYSHRCHVEDLIHVYEDLYRERLRARQYSDAAYARGYQSGLIFVLAEKEAREQLPCYFLFGSNDEIATLEEFVEAAKAAPTLHKTAYRQAVALARGFVKADTVPHHPPMLSPVPQR